MHSDMNNNHPPSFFLKIFRWFCHPDILTPIEGDLMELYDERIEKHGKRIADLRFVIDVIQLLRPGILRPIEGSLKINYYDMFKHNIILTLRNFRKYKNSFLINLIGLSSGIATFLLIYLWVGDEVNKDHFHENKQSVYQVLRNIKLSDGSILTVETNSDLLLPALKEELSEVALATTLMQDISSAILTYQQGQIKTIGKHAGQDFFKVFSYPLIAGNPNTALADKSSIVVSKSLAERLLGTSENVLGKSINLLDNTDGEVIYEGDYIISGVFDMEELNTSESFDFLLTNKLFLSYRDKSDLSWDSNSSNVYITLKNGVNIGLFEEKLDLFYQSKVAEYTREQQFDGFASMFVQKYSERYLYNNFVNGSVNGGRIEYVHLFSIIACIILLIACINFVNLSTALASRRTKELGIKKVMGASKSNLIFQYLSESILLTFLSSLVAIAIVFLVLPYFNALTDKSLALKVDLKFIRYTALFIVAVGLLSGSYPSVFLSGLKIIEALKARLKTSFSEIIIRKGLIIFQFCISTILIISVLVIGQQIDYIQTKNLGLQMDNILMVQKEGKLVRNIDPFMADVRNIPTVVNATILEGSPISFDNAGGGFKRENQPMMQFTFARVGHDYIKTMGIELKAGRSFSRAFGNEGQKIILNETAIEKMGIEDPIGKVVNIRGNREIIGIVKDFHYLSLHNEIKPMFLIYEPDDSNVIAIKVKAGTERQTIADIEKVYKSYNPSLAFNFKFLDDEYDQLYNSELKVAGLSRYFAAIAVLISCLGLFGLAAFSTERRIKEIGIRKILGAGSLRIVVMLTSSFTKMVVVAIVIAIPVAYQVLGNWLDNFAYRISLGWGYFFVGASAALLIACFTVGYQTWSAADVNPVKCIRDE